MNMPREVNMSEGSEELFSNPILAGRFQSSRDPEQYYIAVLFELEEGDDEIRIDGWCSCPGFHFTGGCKHMRRLQEEHHER